MEVRQKRQVWLCVLGLWMAVAFVAWASDPAQAQQQEITGKDGAPMVLVPAGNLRWGATTAVTMKSPSIGSLSTPITSTSMK
jgi:hypothetical protein